MMKPGGCRFAGCCFRLPKCRAHENQGNWIHCLFLSPAASSLPTDLIESLIQFPFTGCISFSSSASLCSSSAQIFLKQELEQSLPNIVFFTVTKIFGKDKTFIGKTFPQLNTIISTNLLLRIRCLPGLRCNLHIKD